jgi:hypothetical protein
VNLPEEVPENAPDPSKYKKAVDAMLKSYHEFVHENPEVLGSTIIASEI